VRWSQEQSAFDPMGDESLSGHGAKFPEAIRGVIGMAYDCEQGTYHLTPTGWVKGDEPPPRRIETWNYVICPASGWWKEIFHFNRAWADEAVDKAARDAMWEKFGMPVMPNRTRDVILIR
jgi:hypothetical protein